MIVIIAAYSPPNKRTLHGNLAGSKKIELIISMLAESKERILLINSAHSEEKFCFTRVKKRKINGHSICEIIPFTVKKRKFGLLLNLLFTISFLFSKKINNANNKLWLYNPYCFENLSCLFLNKIKMKILEIEDMPMSRSRGLKDLLDQLTMKLIISKISIFTYVNLDLLNKFQKKFPGSKNILFPGLVQKKGVLNQRENSGSPLKVGYFGGLNKEKGCGLLCELVEEGARNVTFVVTGFGEYSDRLELLSKQHSNLEFHGIVNDKEMHEIMSSVDIFINPHDPKPLQTNGIFPFKICEYLSYKKPVISTYLPRIGLELNDAVIVVDHNCAAFSNAIKNHEELYDHGKAEMAQSFVFENFTQEAILDKLKGFNVL